MAHRQRGKLNVRLIIATIALVGLGTGVAAQSAPGVGEQRNCQTIRTCQFAKGGSFRGCLSSYSCRTCRYVAANCTVGTRTGNCRRQVCDWGG